MTHPERVSDDELDDIVADEFSPNQRQVDLLAMECQWSRCELSHLRERNAVLQNLLRESRSAIESLGEYAVKSGVFLAARTTRSLVNRIDAALDHPAPQKPETDDE